MHHPVFGTAQPNFSHFCDLKYSSIEAWGSQTTSVEALGSQTQHKNNCLSFKAKVKLFFRQTSLHQNVKYLVGWEEDEEEEGEYEKQTKKSIFRLYV